MKNKLLFFLGVVAAFSSSSLALYKLLNPYTRYVGIYGTGNFREIYEDNAEALQRGDDHLE